jgi:hypothetical protein
MGLTALLVGILTACGGGGSSSTTSISHPSRLTAESEPAPAAGEGSGAPEAAAGASTLRAAYSQSGPGMGAEEPFVCPATLSEVSAIVGQPMNELEEIPEATECSYSSPDLDLENGDTGVIVGMSFQYGNVLTEVREIMEENQASNCQAEDEPRLSDGGYSIACTPSGEVGASYSVQFASAENTWLVTINSGVRAEHPILASKMPGIVRQLLFGP